MVITEIIKGIVEKEIISGMNVIPYVERIITIV